MTNKSKTKNASHDKPTGKEQDLVRTENKPKIKVVFAWHMHQPQYQDQLTGTFTRPWTYLHAIKDYIDMANIILAHPHAKAVFNFTPVLLEQIASYSSNIRNHFVHHEPLNDPLLKALTAPVIENEPNVKRALISQCLKVNEKRLINRFESFKELADIAKQAQQNSRLLEYLPSQYFADLITWYHLAWLGETVRDPCEQTQALISKGKDFSLSERIWLLSKIGHIIDQVIPLYKKLAESGQIELSVTPDKHPILPLLIDFESTLEAMPKAPIPTENYPEGKHRALVHLEKGQTIFKQHFGLEAQGCWPSEGSLSNEALELLSEFGFRWAASGGGVLQNSLNALKTNKVEAHQAIKVGDYSTVCFFRDDNLSDDIGFRFSDWDAKDAVNHLAFHIGNIRKACVEKIDCIVPIILDGENCWEYYRKNGFHFLNLLYETFSNHPDIELTTFSEFLDTDPSPYPLPSLVAGSWVYGTFSTWIGDPSKNRAWEVLCDAKKAYDKAVTENRLPDHVVARAEHQLAICEGSDWFWWFGDYNSAATVAEFDQLYRLHVKNLYQLIQVAPPAYLDEPIGEGKGDPENSGTMRRSHA